MKNKLKVFINNGEKIRAGMKKNGINEWLMVYIFDFLFMLFVHAVLLNDIYTPDSISISDGYHAIEYCYTGRYFLALIYGILQVLGIDCQRHQFAIQLMRLVVYAFGAVFLTKLFSRYDRSTFPYKIIWLNSIVLIAFVNVFFVETFMFVSPDWAIGLLLVLGAVTAFIKARYLISFLLLFCSITTYQSWVFVYVILGMCYILLKDEFVINIKQLKSYVILGALGIGSAALDLISLKILVRIGIFPYEAKKTVIPNILVRTKEILILCKNIFKDGVGMLPKYLLFVYVAFALIVIVCALVKKKKYLHCLWTLVVIGAMFICSFCISYLQANMYLPARIIYPFFFAVSCVGIIAYLLEEKKKVKMAVGLVGAVFLIISAYQVQKVCLDRYSSNALDFEYARVIETKIENYEQNTGMEVNEIRYYPLKNYIGHYYRETLLLPNYNVNMNTRIFFEEWAAISLLNFVNGTDYEGEQMGMEEYTEIFGDKTWDKINLDEQILFKDNVMYWAIF